MDSVPTWPVSLALTCKLAEHSGLEGDEAGPKRGSQGEVTCGTSTLVSAGLIL